MTLQEVCVETIERCIIAPGHYPRVEGGVHLCIVDDISLLAQIPAPISGRAQNRIFKEKLHCRWWGCRKGGGNRSCGIRSDDLGGIRPGWSISSLWRACSHGHRHFTTHSLSANVVHFHLISYHSVNKPHLVTRHHRWIAACAHSRIDCDGTARRR